MAGGDYTEKVRAETCNRNEQCDSHRVIKNCVLCTPWAVHDSNHGSHKSEK